MKKTLLFACLALTTTSFAQFTDANSPAVSNTAYMYVLDTNANNLAGTTGGSAMWDYSSTSGVYGETKNVDVVAASSAPNASDFGSSEIAIEIPGFITAYNTSTASAYSSQGFVFTEPSFGEVVAKFNTNDEQLMTYPGTLNGTWADVVGGTVSTSLGDFPCTGTSNTIIDGSGTLKLNAATTLSGVLRFKIEDSLHVDAGFLGEVIMKRTQFEYYAHSVSNLPVFVHSTIVVTISGSDQATGLVLSAYAPDTYLAVSSQELANVSVYPNPANEVLNIGGLTEDATIQIFSLSGQLVKTVELATGTTTVAIQDLNSGSYLVKATTEKGTLTTKVTVQ